MTILDDYRQQADLISLVEADLGEGRRTGHWVQYRCPFGHEDHHPSLAVKVGDKGGYWKCFACGESGSAIDWLMKYRNMSMRQVLEFIRGNTVTYTPRPRPEPPALEAIPPEHWEAAALEIMDKAEHNLWNTAAGERALQWLTGPERRLTEGTIKCWNLGFSEGMNIGGLKVAYGIVIPCYEGGIISYIKIRRPAGKPKYIKVAGSKPGLFGISTVVGSDTAFVTEGEFDAMLLFYHICREPWVNAGVITAGSATDSITASMPFANQLLRVKRIIAVYDMDEAGQKGYERLAQLGQKVERATLPMGKDITDFVKAGGDLGAWINYQMEGITNVNL
jgi:DNA primase